MNDEVMRILKMVEDSKITAEQGAKLIEAIETATASSAWIDLNEPSTDSGADPSDSSIDSEQKLPSGKKPSWLYIMVDGGELRHGRKKSVRVRIPIKLAKWALKFVPKSAHAEMRKEFGEDFDLSQIGEILDELPVGEDLVNVVDSEDGENVRIFLR